MSKRNRRKPSCCASGGNVLPADSETSSNSQPEVLVQEDARTVQGIDEPTYVRERTLLIEMEQKSADQHDKAILAVASGGLALSVTFLKDIAPHPSPETLKYLGLSWTCFVVGILAILLSFQTSQSACRKQRDFLDNLYQNGSDSQADKNRWASWTNWLNWASYVLVFFAVVFFTFFSWLNLGKGDRKTMSDKPQNQQVQARTEPVEGNLGYVPPKAPVAPSMERKSAPTDSGSKGNKKYAFGQI